ncbi:HNH endonuclease domain-containing protein [Clostridium amylolyticum]|nr:HNH endonuclease domain-containing protein [Clostridium amylolyticum]
MNNRVYLPQDAIITKEIEAPVPCSEKVDTRTFSRLLDDNKVVASYKMYWLLGVLEEVSLGNREIEFNKIVARMIVNAWYPHKQYMLSFGRFDNLKTPINYVADNHGYKSNSNEKKLLDFLCSGEDVILQKMMKDLTNEVPYRLLSPFFTTELNGVKDHYRNKLIVQLSLSSDRCLYKIIKGDKDYIIINEDWDKYLKDNYRIIKAWIYYKLVGFLQKRNPNTPAISFKLEAPKIRNLTKATRLWSEIILNKDIKDMYTGKPFNEHNYKSYGVLSIDHFVPWSFVLHDEMWNLLPTFKNINSSKNNHLMPYKTYIDGFCEIQYKAFSYMCNKNMDIELEDYVNILKLDNLHEYYKKSKEVEFKKRLKGCIRPLHIIALNHGFEVSNKSFANI